MTSLLKLKIISFIIEKNMVELVDNNGKRYYYKGMINSKSFEMYQSGDILTFKNGKLIK